MGPGAIRPRMRAGAAPVGRIDGIHAEPDHLLPGRDTPINPFHTRELNAAELTELLLEAGFAEVTMYGLFHAPQLRAIDERHGGSIIDAQIARAVAEQPWSPELAADVAAVTTADFDIIVAGLEPAHEIDDSLDLIAIAVRH